MRQWSSTRTALPAAIGVPRSTSLLAADPTQATTKSQGISSVPGPACPSGRGPARRWPARRRPGRRRPPAAPGRRLRRGAAGRRGGRRRRDAPGRAGGTLPVFSPANLSQGWPSTQAGLPPGPVEPAKRRPPRPGRPPRRPPPGPGRSPGRPAGALRAGAGAAGLRASPCRSRCAAGPRPRSCAGRRRWAGPRPARPAAGATPRSPAGACRTRPPPRCPACGRAAPCPGRRRAAPCAARRGSPRTSPPRQRTGPRAASVGEGIPCSAAGGGTGGWIPDRPVAPSRRRRAGGSPWRPRRPPAHPPPTGTSRAGDLCSWSSGRNDQAGQRTRATASDPLPPLLYRPRGVGVRQRKL